MAQSSPISAAWAPALKTLKEAFSLIEEAPYCTGSIPLDPATSTLFYRSKGSPAMIDFAGATEAELEALAHACQPASFGQNNKDVLDESYRKAGKMDACDFATQLSLSTGILQALAASSVSAASVIPELYKLNVYGPGSFFKAHVDTPRGDTMFGSLVVILPTVHEGGGLIFRHAGKEWGFDSAKAVAATTSEPQIAFAAFYSDIEHEVLPVVSGYRVTLTYNLHTVSSSIAQPVRIQDHPYLADMKANLAKLLGDSSFLPNGGLLGFGLAYRYPFDPRSTKLLDLTERLKGTDSLIKRLCEVLGLAISLRVVYSKESCDWDSKYFCLTDTFAKPVEWQTEGHIAVVLRDNANATMVYDWEDEAMVGYDEYADDYDYEGKGGLPLAWVKPLNSLNPFQTPYVAYGNEATLDIFYGEVCLVAQIGTSEGRIVAN